ncbi:hypothetical protein [Streptomyces sp. NPDC090994]|uniref:hypothetical protein n=1 Tax=Streptomyces sp. NPDC090994 TaxID=3365969 RepID=UPI00380D626B
MAAVLAVFAATLGVAHADNGDAVAASAAAEGEMPGIVEDFNYPGSAQIYEETGALLKRGDGHIVMVPCDGNNDIWIMSNQDGAANHCFNVTAKPAYLTLEIPKAHGIWTKAYPVKTTLREDDGTTTVVNAPANDFTGYGESGASGERTMLIELRVTA